ncbi:MAG: hypothetical protein IJX98_04985 [Clostridia bacterium]|nr:hypothetical protein [Clostridia bacterium]
MQNRDNGYTEISKAEQGMTEEAQTNGAQEVGSTALGKFKSVDALMQAYQSLQAEFTRRSQRLKRLEQEEENRKRECVRGIGETNADAEREQGGQTPEQAELGRPSEVEESVDERVLEKGRERRENGRADEVSEESGVAMQTGAESTTDLYELIKDNEELKARVIADYLSSIRFAGAPLMRGGAGNFPTAPKRLGSISEAGNQTLLWLQQRKNGM